jgi:hypothetical protein
LATILIQTVTSNSMIKYITSIILILFCLNTFSQPCGGKFSSGFYHIGEFVNESGDTLNKLNKNGLYQGLHLYTDNENNLYNDLTDYTLGYYDNGVPIGEWKEHCESGIYSVGMYSIGGAEVTSDGNGGWIEKKQGIYAKIGEWKYYNSNDSLIKTEIYERLYNRKGWTEKNYLKVNGENVLIEFDFNSKHNSKSKYKAQTNIIYRTDKSIKTKSQSNFFKNVTISYYSNGQIKSFFKCKKFLGKKLNKSVSKKFNEDGQLLKKEKDICWTVTEYYQN